MSAFKNIFKKSQVCNNRVRCGRGQSSQPRFELPKKCKSSFPSTAPMSNNLSPCLLPPLLRKDREQAVKCLSKKKKKKSECCLLNFLKFLNALIREKKRDGSIRNPSKIKKTMILYWLLLEIHLQPLVAKIIKKIKSYSLLTCFSIISQVFFAATAFASFLFLPVPVPYSTSFILTTTVNLQWRELF